MKLAFFLCLIGAILAGSAAGIAAGEAWRLSDPRNFKVAIFLAIPSLAVTLALFVVGVNNGYFNGRTSDHVGFGPDWHCLTNSPRTGGDFCIRDLPPAQPPKGGSGS